MGAYELNISERPKRNPITGRFMKGCVPANKGKRWVDFMTRQGMKNAKKGWKNLEKFRKKGANAGWNKRAVVCITEDGVFVGRFESGAEAARQSGASPRNIGECCSGAATKFIVTDKKTGKRYHATSVRKYAGKTIDGRRLRWFYEDDDRWLKLVNN